MKKVQWMCLALFLSACVTEEEIRPAIQAVNAEFGHEYELVLSEIGSRHYPISIDSALAALSRSLSDMGMRVVSQNSMTGMLLTRAPAPRPLTDEQWQSAAKTDQPMMQRIIRPYVGAFSAQFVKFEPEGLDILIRAIVVPSGDQVEISLTMRMEEVTPPPSGRPRREYAPPTAVRVGLQKIWNEFDRQVEGSRR